MTFFPARIMINLFYCIQFAVTFGYFSAPSDANSYSSDEHEQKFNKQEKFPEAVQVAKKVSTQ